MYYIRWHHCQLEMWANAQRDGRPAEYRWRPVLNAAVWLTPTTTECRAVTLPRCEPTAICRGAPNYQTDLSRKFTILWGHVEEILLLNKFFFRLSIRALVAKI